MWKEKKLSSAECFAAPAVSYILNEENQDLGKLEPLCVVLSELKSEAWNRVFCSLWLLN